MRIAMIGPFGLEPNRTMSSRALNLARALVRLGHDAAIFMPPWQTPDQADRLWEDEGVRLRYTPLGSNTLTTTRNLLQEALAWHPQIVHGFKPKAYSGLAMWWLWQTRRARLRLILDMDDWEGSGGWNDLAPYTAVQKRFFDWQEQWGIGHAHAITVASRALQSIVWSAGVPVSAVHYIPNGSGLPPHAPAPSAKAIRDRRKELGLGARPTLLVYSRFFEFDIGRLVAILSRLKERIPDLAILFIGESLRGDDGQDLRRRLRDAGLLPAIVDLGWLDEADLPLSLHLSDAAIYLMDDTLLNRTKCPVKLADLIAAGRPVVAEDVGQISEYVLNGHSGLLRPTGDIEGLTADLQYLLQDAESRARFGQEAERHYQAAFDWDLLATRLLRAYKSSGDAGSSA